MRNYEFELTFLCRGYGEWKEITKGIVNTIKDFDLEKEIEELKKEYTIVIVTHNMQQALRVADHTAFFLVGEMVEYGETKDIFSYPQDKRTEDYITGRFG